MDSTSIYGAYEPALEAVMQDLIGRIRASIAVIPRKRPVKPLTSI